MTCWSDQKPKKLSVDLGAQCRLSTTQLAKSTLSPHCRSIRCRSPVFVACVGVFTVIQEYWRNGHLSEAGGFGASVWILDFTIISAMLWVIVQTTRGRNWARIISLASYVRADSSRDDYGFGSAK
jgi:hypothetical protein